MSRGPSGTDSVSTIEVFEVVMLVTFSMLESPMLYLTRYIEMSPDTGGCHEMFCCIWILLSFSLTDTGPLIRSLTTPGLCAAEGDGNIQSDNSQVANQLNS